jgi:peptidylprolyl isomerase
MSLERKRPEIDFPEGQPPAALLVTDEILGEGPEAASGATVTAHYVGVAFSTGEEFDASWNRGEPLRFKLGVGQVIPGWDQGISGMRVGGRRRLVIPPDLGYGERGAGAAIGPNETLIFVVDLVDAQ